MKKFFSGKDKFSDFLDRSFPEEKILLFMRLIRCGLTVTSYGGPNDAQ